MTQPPFIPFRILAFCLHPADRDEVLGDLAEMHRQIAMAEGRRTADRWYRLQALRSAPPFLIQSFAWSTIMFSNYLKLTIRTLRKQKLQGIVNLAGLSVGLALCALIILFVRDELSYDRFHEDHERIVQLQEWRMAADGEIGGGNTNLSVPVGQAAADEIASIDSFSRLASRDLFVRSDAGAFEETSAYVDPAFLDIFSFELVAGSGLSGANDVVLTRSAAMRLFGTNDPIGRVLEVRMNVDYAPYTVVGVVADPPPNSTLQFDLLLPIQPWLAESYPQALDSYGWSLVQTYARLRPQSDLAAVNESLEALYAKYNGDYLDVLRERYGYGEDVQTAGYEAMPLADVYLSRFSDVSYSFILSAIGLGILLIACINFMTMAIGRSLARSREVGIRKVVGAGRSQLVGQFWGEALIMTLLSALVGLLLAWNALPLFNNLTGKSLTFDLFTNWSLPAVFLAIVLFTGLVSGSYPALVLSSFRPVDILKNKLRVSGSNLFTKALVTLQFALSVTLIISVLVMREQMDHLSDRDLGFDTEQVVLVELNGLDGPATARRYREILEGRSEIAGVTTAANALGYRGSSGFGIQWEGRRVNIDVLSVDHRFLDEMGIDVIAGRSFDPNRAADSTGVVVVNQALVNTFGLENPIGSIVPGLPEEEIYEIIGVVPDFNYQALYQDVGPLMMAVQDFWGFEYLYVRLSPGPVDRSLDLLRDTWAGITTDIPFSYEFLDERMARVYARDERWERIVNSASIVAILLALLGLFGLTSLSVRSRLKEFGIRKTLGASTPRLIRMVSRDFVAMILVGSALAVPAAFLITRNWLDNFAFRTEVGPWVYALAVALVLVGALLTIAAQSLRSAGAAPMELLDRE